jgi:hypothetical protein
MSRFEGPQGIVTNGLVLNLDAGDPDSYTRSQPPYVEVLVVAGGGCGGNGNGLGYEAGGGGAGGVLYNSAYQLTNASAITVTIGAGGGSKTVPGNGNNGSNSVFGSLIAVGGGGGSTGSGTGQSGGSGGGGAHPKTQGGAGTAGQGFQGVTPPDFSRGGGGGGAGGTGNLGVGGNGVAYSISGTSTYYGGGGGGTLYSPNNGGLGGGGNGSTVFRGTSTATGTANTGGGGGGGYSDTDTLASGGAGGSGIVIIRYPGLPAATGGTITYLNGYTIHTFTTSGTFTPYLWNDVTGNDRNATLNGLVTGSMQTNGGILSVYNPVVGLGQPDFFNFSPGSTSGYNPLNYANCSVTVAFRWNATNDYWERVFDFGRGGNNTGVGLNALIFTRYSTTSDLYIITHGSLANVTVKIGELNIGTWQIYTITWNAGSQIYYKNGSVYTSTTSASSLANYFGATRTNEQYYLGKSNWSDAGARISYGAFIIHDRVLSATEVTQMYNALRFRYGL